MAFGLGAISEDSNLIFMKTLKLYDMGEVAMDLNQVLPSNNCLDSGNSVNLLRLQFPHLKSRKVTWMMLMFFLALKFYDLLVLLNSLSLVNGFEDKCYLA